MANLILRDFRLTRDFRSVNWRATVGYNLMRAAAAGLIWGILLFCTLTDKSGQRIPALLAAPLFFPIGYFCVYLPLGLFLSAIGGIVPFVGLLSLFVALIFVTVGDPLICVLYAIAPRTVPLHRPSFLSLALIYYVLKPEETASVAVSH